MLLEYCWNTQTKCLLLHYCSNEKTHITRFDQSVTEALFWKYSLFQGLSFLIWIHFFHFFHFLGKIFWPKNIFHQILPPFFVHNMTLRAYAIFFNINYKFAVHAFALTNFALAILFRTRNIISYSQYYFALAIFFRTQTK